MSEGDSTHVESGREVLEQTARIRAVWDALLRHLRRRRAVRQKRRLRRLDGRGRYTGDSGHG